MSSRSVHADETVTWWHDYYRLVLNQDHTDSNPSIAETQLCRSRSNYGLHQSDYQLLETRDCRYDLAGFGLQFQFHSDTGRLSLPDNLDQSTASFSIEATLDSDQNEWETQIIESWEWIEASWSASSDSVLVCTEWDEEMLPLHEQSFLWSDSEMSEEDEIVDDSNIKLDFEDDFSFIDAAESTLASNESHQSTPSDTSQPRSLTSWS